MEAAELLELLTRGVLSLEKSPLRGEAIGPLLRHAHTLKGAARVVRQIEIADAAHALEDELTALREDANTAPNVEALLRLLDTMGEHLKQLDAPAANPTANSAVKESTPNEPAPVKPSQPVAVVRADVSQLNAVRESIAESLSELAQLRRDGGELSALRELGELIERQSLSRRLNHVEQYETLLGSIHAVVGDLLQGAKRFERNFNATLERVNRELHQARLTSEQVQLVNAGTIFDSLERAVRDAGVELRKDVRFEAVGGGVRLDGHVLDVVHRALSHLVRNAVAHGIEPKADRTKAGKSVTGVVKVEVTRHDQRIRFRCQDDGRGIDVERLSHALHVGTGDSQLSGPALLDALLNSGVSTAGQVSSIAGRGIGMSAVREAAVSIGAQIQLHNEPGRGVVFDLLVPVMLSSLTGLWVEVGSETVVIPLTSVRKTLKLDTLPAVEHGTELMRKVDDRLVRYVPLDVLLGGEGREVSRAAVLLRLGEQELILGVSRIVGCQTQVVHGLPSELPPLPMLSGAVLDAEGIPQLVLDVAGVFAVSSGVQVAAPAPRRTFAPILIVDDSLTTRMLEQSILESAGYAVQLATSAEQALEMAAQTQYSLFLVDVEMPGMDGFTFVKTTRAHERHGRVPAILVSSRSAPADLAQGKAAGAAAYIVKDHFDQRELLRQIRTILGE